MRGAEDRSAGPRDLRVLSILANLPPEYLLASSFEKRRGLNRGLWPSANRAQKTKSVPHNEKVNIEKWKGRSVL